MVATDSWLSRWFRAIGRSLGFRGLQNLVAVPGPGKAARRKPSCAHRRFEVDSEARRLTSELRSKTDTMTAGQLSERALRRLSLIGDGHQ